MLSKEHCDFVNAAKDDLNYGEYKEFVCPICGGNARAKWDTQTGKIHASCDKCQYKVRMEV